jgi:hypothetical protein
MKNPQLENGFIRIANELYNEILRRNFTKRQQNIVLFIWRLSYGCGKKDCIIDKFNYFELAGLDKSDIKKELKYLKMCNVIQWDEQTMIFAINKDYDLWQINPNKNWDDDKFKKLIALNLKVGKIPTDVGKTPTNDMVGEIPTEVGEIPTLYYDEVGKIPTSELVKYQPQEAANLTAARDSAPVNTILNTNIKDDNDMMDKPNPYLEFEKAFGHLPTAILQMEFDYFMDCGKFKEPEAIICEVIKRAKEQNPSRPDSYVKSILKDIENKGLYTLEAVKEHNEQFDQKTKRVGTAKKPRGGVNWDKLRQMLREEEQKEASK